MAELAVLAMMIMPMTIVIAILVKQMNDERKERRRKLTAPLPWRMYR